MYPNSKCIGIEPIFWQEYEKKWENDSRVTLIRGALSDTIGEKVLYVPSVFSDLDHGLSSFYHRKIFDINQNTKQIGVNCTTLDALSKDLKINFIDYLKIDTEGSELPVLQGCENLLSNKKIEYIQLEYGGTYKDAGYTISNVIDFLKQYDYQLIFKTEKSQDNNQSGEMLFHRSDVEVYNVSKTCQIENLSSIYEKYFGFPSKGTFVEIGAYDGDSFSNTSCLADHGWEGIYVEPVSQFYLKCTERHKNNNVQIVQCSIGDAEKEMDIFVCDGLTTTNKDLLQMYSEIDWSKDCVFHQDKCNQVRLDKLLREYKINPDFELLVIDVEGNEENVFNSFDLKFWKPQMLIVELIDDHQSFQKYEQHIETNKNLRNMILKSGYVEVYRDIINTVFVRRELYNKK